MLAAHPQGHASVSIGLLLKTRRETGNCAEPKFAACYEVSTVIEDPLFGNEPSLRLRSTQKMKCCRRKLVGGPRNICGVAADIDPGICDLPFRIAKLCSPRRSGESPQCEVQSDESWRKSRLFIKAAAEG
jgi:hypothetical protein